MKFIQSWCGVGVSCRLAVLFGKQMSFEDSINHVDVIEHSYRTVQRIGMLRCSDSRKYVEQFVVRPGLLRKE